MTFQDALFLLFGTAALAVVVCLLIDVLRPESNFDPFDYLDKDKDGDD